MKVYIENICNESNKKFWVSLNLQKRLVFPRNKQTHVRKTLLPTREKSKENTKERKQERRERERERERDGGGRRRCW